jgi:nucleoside-diphosphate-sugar epimerase
MLSTEHQREAIVDILFIGGTGNISSDCVTRLLCDGHHIHIIGRGNRPFPENCTAHVADRKDLSAMRRALGNRSFDVAINFLGYDVPDLEIDYALLNGKTDQYIFISTAMVYAKPHTQLPITESAPKGNAYSDYAQKKQRCEAWLEQKYRETGFPYTIVRPSHTYSKRWIPNTVSSAGYTVAARLEAGKALFVPDEGDTPWALTATSDFAAGLAGLVGNPRTIGESFHITTDEALTWNQIYAELADALGVPPPTLIPIPVDFICRHFPDQEASLLGDKANPGVFDNSKIKSFVPSFHCEKPFRTGIREAVSYLSTHPNEQNIRPEVDATFDAVIDAWRTNHVT